MKVVGKGKTFVRYELWFQAIDIWTDDTINIVAQEDLRKTSMLRQTSVEINDTLLTGPILVGGSILSLRTAWQANFRPSLRNTTTNLK